MGSVEADECFSQGLDAFSKREFRFAAELFEKAAALDSSNPHYYYYLGISLRELGDRASAEKHLSHAVSLLPDAAAIRYVRAEIRLENGDFSKAAEDFLYITSDESEENRYWKSLSYLGLGLIRIEEGDIEAALTLFSEAEDIARELNDTGLLSRISSELEKSGF
ncbi:MAG TPA: tetratricopeptide repeat protein [Methanocorpusculum sp.]|nr:tetratricopeptide repeat protein [Methanocorpusculum sp.]